MHLLAYFGKLFITCFSVNTVFIIIIIIIIIIIDFIYVIIITSDKGKSKL